jgi:hypothetical protein
VECARIRRAIPNYETLVPNGRLARSILLTEIKEGEDSIASGDMARMVKPLASLRDLTEVGKMS